MPRKNTQLAFKRTDDLFDIARQSRDALVKASDARDAAYVNLMFAACRAAPKNETLPLTGSFIPNVVTPGARASDPCVQYRIREVRIVNGLLELGVTLPSLPDMSVVYVQAAQLLPYFQENIFDAILHCIDNHFQDANRPLVLYPHRT